MPPSPEEAAASRRKVSLATAKGVPIFLALIVAYVSYVITGPLAVQYLLNPPSDDIPQRIAAGIAIPIAYYLILIPVFVTWLRLLFIVWRDPGFVPLGEPRSPDAIDPAPGLEEFYERDVFACDWRGLPLWCRYCNNWKPDRAHHTQDVGRCTHKMDHFCPWVGGVVGEWSYKFFVQFCFYSVLLSTYAMIALAYFVAERKVGSDLEVRWIVALGLAAFFCLFTVGMVLNSCQMVFQNVTTIENISPDTRTMLLAVLLPPHLQGQNISGPPQAPMAAHTHEGSTHRSGSSERPLTSELDDPSHSTYFSNAHAPRHRRRSSVLPYQNRVWKGTVTYPLTLPTDRPPLPAPQPRTFAILETLPGMNIWDLGGATQNFKAVFGSHLHDWLLPVKHSPCRDHTSLVSQYPLGPDFEELLVEAGLLVRPNSLPIPPNPPPAEKHGKLEERKRATDRKRKRRKRRLDDGWQNGERPDGWATEKEARRVRNEARRGFYEGTGAVPPPPPPARSRRRSG